MSPHSPVIPVAPRNEVGGTSPQLTLAQAHSVSLICHFATGQGFAGDLPTVSGPRCPRGGQRAQAGSAVPWLAAEASAARTSTELGVE